MSKESKQHDNSLQKDILRYRRIFFGLSAISGLLALFLSAFLFGDIDVPSVEEPNPSTLCIVIYTFEESGDNICVNFPPKLFNWFVEAFPRMLPSITLGLYFVSAAALILSLFFLLIGHLFSRRND